MPSVDRFPRWVFWTVPALILALLVIVWLFWGVSQPEAPAVSDAVTESKRPRMVNYPATPDEPVKPNVDWASDAPQLEMVRKALREGISPARAVVMAAELPDQPERADAAFLLLDYAAENGIAEAALAVAGYYDPVGRSPSGSILKDPQMAYEWYQAALQGGERDAAEKLEQLRQWVIQEAERGSMGAKELLEIWP